MYQRKNWYIKGKIKMYYSLSDVQNETQLWQDDYSNSYLPIWNPFVVYIIRINQSDCSPLLSRKRDQSKFSPIMNRNTHVWLYYYLLVTMYLCLIYDTHLTNLWPIGSLIVAHLWPTYASPVTHLRPYCYSLVTVYAFLKIARNYFL